jgi:hypothetical protein
MNPVQMYSTSVRSLDDVLYLYREPCEGSSHWQSSAAVASPSAKSIVLRYVYSVSGTVDKVLYAFAQITVRVLPTCGPGAIRINLGG